MAQQQADQFPQFDFLRYMGDLPFPAVDIAAVVDCQRKTMDAMAEANRLAYDGLQAVMRCQVSIMREAMDDVAQVARDMVASGTAEDKASRQADAARAGIGRSLTGIREMVETATRTNTQALDLLSRRFAGSIDEMYSAFTKAARP